MQAIQKPHILLIEDDPEIGELVCEYLGQNHFHTTHTVSGSEGLDYVAQHGEGLNAIILDLMLPDLDGLAICQKIRTLPSPMGQIPIIMLTAKGDAMDRILGLELGADDYLPKPFEPRELLARLKAILRRNQQPPTTASEASVLTFGSLSINPNNRSVTLGGKACNITGYQFDILYTLAQRAGQVVSREALMNSLKNQSFESFDRSIDVHISRLRAAIEADSKHPKRIQTVRGVGYLFAAKQL